MAQKLQIDWEQQDKLRTELALEEISKSANLRFFVNTLLDSVGINETPHHPDPNTAAFLAGRHSVALDLLRLMIEYRPELYPALIAETLRENSDRKQKDQH